MDRIRQEMRDPPGFPSLTKRVMDETKPEALQALFVELGRRMTQPGRIEVGASSALILAHLLRRQIQAVALIDELPPEIRSRHDLLHELAAAYGVSLTNFQSHYLPSGWRERLWSLGRFERLDVFVVDRYDVLASKLTSARRKDRDDLRAVLPLVDAAVLLDRLRVDGASLLSAPGALQNARDNWAIVFRQGLPLA